MVSEAQVEAAARAIWRVDCEQVGLRADDKDFPLVEGLDAYTAFARAALTAAQAAGSGSGAEGCGVPVAYLQEHPPGGNQAWSWAERVLSFQALTDADKSDGWSETPLYAAPPPPARKGGEG